MTALTDTQRMEFICQFDNFHVYRNPKDYCVICRPENGTDIISGGKTLAEAIDAAYEQWERMRK